MKVEQAVFASSDRGRMGGYQVIAKSPGVDQGTCKELCRWAPTQAPSHDPKQWTINYYPVSDDSIAVTRTVLGGPEYSCRGGTQVVTMILLLRNEQFLSYDCNSIEVARTALMLGYLRLPLNMACEQLPLAELPDRPIIDTSLLIDQDTHDDLLDEISELVQQSRRVAIVGLAEPIDAVEKLLPKLSVETRRKLSYSTGLAPVVSRPFQAHFLPDVDAARRRTLDLQDIVCVNAR